MQNFEFWCFMLLYPHSTRLRSMAIWAIWQSATNRIGLGWFGGPAIRLRPINVSMVPWQRSMRPDGDLMTTDRQSTFCKAAIEPDQITLYWRSDVTRKWSACAPLVMLDTYGVQFPVWLRCRWPLLIRLQCTRSYSAQITTWWQQSYESRRRSDAIIDV